MLILKIKHEFRVRVCDRSSLFHARTTSDQFGIKTKHHLLCPSLNSCFILSVKKTRCLLSKNWKSKLIFYSFSWRFLDLADLIPQVNPGGNGRLLKPEFRNALNKHGFPMDDVEFEKLWQKYDTENIGVVKGDLN